MKHATETGMGRVCEQKARVTAPVAHERDLFGFDVERAVRAARERLAVQVASAVAEAHMEVKRQAHALRVARLGWVA
jgi:hypothetical protein